MFKLFKALTESAVSIMRMETPDGVLREVEFVEGKTVLEAAEASGVEILNSCGGMGTCGTCRIEVIEGEQLLDEPNEVELETAKEKLFKKNERLACQVHAKSGFRVRVLS